jgi:membrane-associated protease RseP (regulator of RpoE activity)
MNLAPGFAVLAFSLCALPLGRVSGAGEEGRPFFGVRSRPLPPEVAAHAALEEGRGLLVDEVCPGSPAEAAGIRRHDILLEINGHPLLTCEQMQGVLGEIGRGGRARVTLRSRGETLEKHAVLGDLTEPTAVAAAESQTTPQMPQRRRVLIPSPAARTTPPDALSPFAVVPPQRLIRRDSTGEYVVTVENGRVTFTVTPSSGEGGHWVVDSPEQRARVPEAYREKLALMLPEHGR